MQLSVAAVNLMGRELKARLSWRPPVRAGAISAIIGDFQGRDYVFEKDQATLTLDLTDVPVGRYPLIFALESLEGDAVVQWPEKVLIL